MTNSPERQHGGTHAGSPPIQAELPEPTHAERARTLMHVGGVGSLSTMSKKHPGFPFGSLMPYGLGEEGEPTFLISSMAMHTKNLVSDARATLLVVQPASDGNPLGAARVSVMGEVQSVGRAERDLIQRFYLMRNPNAQHWVDFDDFAFYRMRVVDLYFVGGFGVMGWVSAEEYRTARPDPLADAAAGILAHMNEGHIDSLLLLAKHYCGFEADEADMTAVDRLGFHVRLRTSSGYKGARLAFPHAVETPEQVRQTLIEMVNVARNTS